MRRRIVVKVGSNVLTTDRWKLDITRMSALVDQIAWLREQGYQVVLVTSGAVACGRGELHVDHSLDSVEQRQLFSAMGQVKLVNLYYDLFREYNIHVGQVLTTKENFQSERSYQNQRACMEVMLENGVLPIVNENDTVSIEELMFTDNDELSGLIARMMGAEMLVLLTGVDGLYNGNPMEPGSEVIRQVRLGDDVSRFILPAKSKAGRGGMTSKFNTALAVAQAGIRVIIANGNRDAILPALIENPAQTVHTEFLPLTVDQ
ncbi:MAG: glutamate 5-kinase [Bacteroidaceae bacterium]|nr:glutamate 5-kinase [Bacteroidaceae bacterium]